MVGTGETLAVALALGADLGPTVRAGVQVDRRLAIGATLDDQVAPADVAGDEVAGLAQFAEVGGIQPAVVEYLVQFAPVQFAET